MGFSWVSSVSIAGSGIRWGWVRGGEGVVSVLVGSVFVYLVYVFVV